MTAFISIKTALLFSLFINGCLFSGDDAMTMNRDNYKKGHLTARPVKDINQSETRRGLLPLGYDKKRDGFIYVPANYNSAKPASLAVMLHGAGGQAEHGLNLIKSYADDHNIILIAPASRLATWDIIASDSFDSDVIFIDQALKHVFRHYNIAANRIAIGGFSDGASYALSLGLSNGDLFTHVIAFSPGFAYTIENKGKPGIFISHGVKDHVLPIDPCSRKLVPRFKSMGYKVHYEEFQGEHEIPKTISSTAIEWFTGKGQ